MKQKYLFPAYLVLALVSPELVSAKVWVLAEKECQSNTITGSFDATDSTSRQLSLPGELHFCMRYEDKKNRRCEVSYQYLLQRERETTISFDVKLDSDWSFDDSYPTDTDWAAIFQIHEKPDAGEQWRCPLAALEVVAHKVRMFNRWDNSKISQVAKGGCAGPGATIQSRPVIAGEPIDAGTWHHFEIHYLPSLSDNGHLSVSLDGRLVGDVHGPTVYNDDAQPFIKFGIYKPTAWREASAECLTYRNISVRFADQSASAKP